MELICPVCGGSLTREPQRYICSAGHCFDRARQGYVNLLMKQRSRLRGDSAEMVRARREFLSAGWYRPLLDAAAGMLRPMHPKRIGDIGCGEGWYACTLLEMLPDAQLTGIDISPEALRYAAVRARENGLAERTHWAAASVNRLPFDDASCDLLLNFFAPCEPHEFARVLSPEGALLRAIPLEKHLWELKAAVYDEPYENRPVLTPPEGFALTEFRRIEYTMTLTGEHLANLFAMTPYSRKTARQDADKLSNLPELTTQAAFGLMLCHPERRNGV